ncbi:DUF6646 family protein [Hyunsoonleella pacifica]|uniref:Outer membrane protein beta-barrel domain-containing protein n=1 Tax=Hyunsoonleella pacifica TaxID=1080224 RepID=A0A4Q9FSD2_9FLAO|nr:DUF6646 family protein [Hyunsoonleella pacifica]TBN16534.1 hypothetical protein EYD46_07805 [Hyunsoonleella pacifica]GGD18606.1 OmpA family outer membrane protein [Hyunsoonleella pacifica]
MKKLILVLAILSVSLINAQAYTGKNDNKFQVGLNAQDNGTGINISYDYGFGENISFGFTSTYLLGVEESIDASFTDRFDIRARFNANLGNVVNVSDNFDIYPGLSLGMKNFGGHLGMRYFFTEGFGIYTELNTPLAKFNSDGLTPAEMLHNQFTVNFGASFNL